ncbi:MAG: hypothetical protein ACRDKY_05120 [Solirubrobacteraceae bacterium]
MSSLGEQVLRECDAMARYALESGMSVPSDVIRFVDGALEAQRAGGASRSRADLDRLSKAHDKLAAVVAPATPRTILLLAQRSDSWLAPLGPVRFIRQMLVVVIALLAIFITLATSPHIDANSGDLFNSSGTKLLLNELFFLAAGGMGAAFAALFTAHRYIAAGTYDPKYESTYWIQFILGLMAGLLLPALLPIGGEPESSHLTKPLLALVGGFSASVLYRILDRLVSTVESLVRGDARELNAAARGAEVARVSQRAREEQLAIAAELVRLRERANQGIAQADLTEELDQIVRRLVPAASVAEDRNGRATRAQQPTGDM